MRASNHVDPMDARREYRLALTIDMTARNLQEEVKKKGLPWSAVKGFDTFTPIGYADQLDFAIRIPDGLLQIVLISRSRKLQIPTI